MNDNQTTIAKKLNQITTVRGIMLNLKKERQKTKCDQYL